MPLLVGACALLRPAQAPLHPEGPRGGWYIVQPGETLAQIAARTRVPVEDLLEINGLRRDDPLPAGKLLFLLDAGALAAAVAEPSSTPAPGTAPRRPAPVAPREAPPGTPVVISPRPGDEPTPLRWPLSSPLLSSPFGARQGRVHEGIDLAAPTGTPIFAAQAGQVLYAGDAVRGYGNMVVVQHDGDLLSVYAHSSVLLVRTGDRVRAGQEIARVGQTGRATAPHLHFEVRRGQVPQDPLRFLPRLGGQK
jgi:murein DD-endopeptidase MepM/ murein hydrolase activator NlpD